MEKKTNEVKIDESEEERIRQAFKIFEDGMWKQYLTVLEKATEEERNKAKTDVSRDDAMMEAFKKLEEKMSIQYKLILNKTRDIEKKLNRQKEFSKKLVTWLGDVNEFLKSQVVLEDDSDELEVDMNFLRNFLDDWDEEDD